MIQNRQGLFAPIRECPSADVHLFFSKTRTLCITTPFTKPFYHTNLHNDSVNFTKQQHHYYRTSLVVFQSNMVEPCR